MTLIYGLVRALGSVSRVGARDAFRIDPFVPYATTVFGKEPAVKGRVENAGVVVTSLTGGLVHRGNAIKHSVFGAGSFIRSLSTDFRHNGQEEEGLAKQICKTC